MTNEENAKALLFLHRNYPSFTDQGQAAHDTKKHLKTSYLEYLLDECVGAKIEIRFFNQRLIALFYKDGHGGAYQINSNAFVDVTTSAHLFVLTQEVAELVRDILALESL